jgi:polyisoprenoid-binding protein YceI
MKTFFALLVALVISVSASAQSTWMFDASHSSVNFTVSHMMVSETAGKFKKFDGKIVSKADDFAGSEIEFTVDIASVNTEDAKRDEHLQQADWFDAAKFPKMSFKSKSFTKLSDKKYKLVGDLTMHGVTKEVTLDAELKGMGKNPYNKKDIAGFKVTGTVNRKDFGVGATTPGAGVGEEIALVCNVEIVKS